MDSVSLLLPLTHPQPLTIRRNTETLTLYRWQTVESVHHRNRRRQRERKGQQSRMRPHSVSFPSPPDNRGTEYTTVLLQTRVAQEVLKSLGVPWVLVVSQDNFYKTLSPEESAAARASNHGEPQPFHSRLLLGKIPWAALPEISD